LRILEDTFQLKLHIPGHTEEAAYGAALFGLVSAGIYNDMLAANKIIKY
jgi:hypothetical protein